MPTPSDAPARLEGFFTINILNKNMRGSMIKRWDLPALVRLGCVATHFPYSDRASLRKHAVAAFDERAYAEAMAHLQESTLVDWTDCPLIEVVPGKVSGVPLLKGTRLPADTVLSNFESGSPVEEIADNFDMPEETIRDLLTYAANKQKQLQP